MYKYICMYISMLAVTRLNCEPNQLKLSEGFPAAGLSASYI